MARATQITGLLLALYLALGRQASATTAEQAQAFTGGAVAYVHEGGRDRAFADFSRLDGGYVDGELYVFSQDASGVVVAHGGNPGLVGRNLGGVRDSDGRYPNVELNRMDLEDGTGWARFRWPNPAINLIAPKVAYVINADDHTVRGSGQYEP
jgi:signal transduction histidine kinase